MNIAVTGASGFLGRHVVAAFHQRGISPTLVSGPGNPSSPAKPVKNPTSMLSLNILDDEPGVYERLGRPDVLVHLAWGGLPNFQSPHHIQDEMPAHFRFLKKMIDGGLEHLIVSGSCLEYGLQNGALSEAMRARPAVAYARAKNQLRELLDQHPRKKLFRMHWLRIFYIFGEGQSPTSLLPQLQLAVARGDPAFKMSQGKQIRDFHPVTTAANEIVSVSLSEHRSDIINICSGKPISVLNFVESLLIKNKWKIGLQLGDFQQPSYEPEGFWGLRRKLDTILGGAR